MPPPRWPLRYLPPQPAVQYGLPQGADNTACLEWGHHVIGGRERAKHIDIRKHFAHEVIQREEMRLVKIDTSLQLADIFTKPLPYPQFLECLQGILRIKSRVN